MPRRRSGPSPLSLHFPLGGVDRSVSYQYQQPFTTPNALNVWPDGAIEGRERGGSRPGLGFYIWESVSTGPVRLLDSVNIFVEPDSSGVTANGSERFEVAGDTLGPIWFQPPIAATSFRIADGGAIPTNPANLAGAINFASDGRTLGTKHRYGIYIAPYQGTIAGTYKIYFNFNSSMLSGETATLTLADDGSYSGDIEGTVFSGTTDQLGGGWFFITLSKSGSDYLATGTWKNQDLGTVNVGPAAGSNWGFGVQWLTTIGGQVTRTSTRFPSTKKIEYRKDILVKIADGDLYYESSPLEFTQLGGGYKFADDRLIQSAEYLQKLYIADYGKLREGTDGDLAAPTNTLFTDGAGTNFESEGVTDDYVLFLKEATNSRNEVQQVSITDSDGGTFTLSYQGEATADIAWNASATEVGDALEALANIDTVGVVKNDTGGGTPITLDITFTGDLAGTNVDQLTADGTNLTNSGAPPDPAISVATTAGGVDKADAIGTYDIDSVDGTEITLASAPDVSGIDLGALTYAIVKQTKIFDPKELTLTTLRAEDYEDGSSKGIAPVGCRLATAYLDRLVLGAPFDAPHLFFMSRQGNPLDWDYSQLDAGGAYSSSAGEGGQIGDPLTALIPHSDRCMFVACYSSLWIVRGDPKAGGEIDTVSRDIGVVGESAFCHTPDGNVVILSQDGLYYLPSGCRGEPTSLSRERLPLEMILLNPSEHIVQLAYDVLHRGIHIFLTREDKSLVYHWWFDWDTQSFWPIQLPTDLEPTATVAYTPIGGGRYVLLGGRDGQIRYFDRNHWNDSSGDSIDSYVDIGPFRLANDYNIGKILELQCELARGSAPVDWTIRTGSSASDAVRENVGTERWSGTFGERFNFTARPNARGHSAVVRLQGSVTQPWAFEQMMAVVEPVGRRRRWW